MSIPKTIIVNSAKELGELARAKRLNLGVSIRKTAAENQIGVRFLSEFERGKTTSEIGKIITALHAIELDLAIVPRKPAESNAATTKNQLQPNTTNRLSKKLDLEFPYDWSNAQMDESTFIRLVLEKTRFNDILRICHYFGIEQVKSEAGKLTARPQASTIYKLLGRIQIGIQRSKSHVSTY